MRPPPTIWLLTGVTGFLGKVVLAELIRRREELGVRDIRVIVRPRGARRAQDRFREEVAASPGLAGLPVGWPRWIRVLDGDLERPDLGRTDLAEALAGVTHVVHAAASIEFDLPARDALRANHDTTRNLLALAQGIPTLRRFVYVSTAYVTPHTGDETPIPERLVSLPDSADALVQQIRAGAIPDDALLRRTGHPNTYTLTKCLAEHLVEAERGNVPVSIVRPSIISAARRHPFPAWIDSAAGFGAFAVLLGLGHLRAIIGSSTARLDIVPVDDVADRILTCAVGDSRPFAIRHAVTGLGRAPTVGECWRAVTEWFMRHPVQRLPRRAYLGRDGLGFRLADLWHHRLPLAVGAWRRPSLRRRAEKLAGKLKHLNRVFPYFTSRSFAFATEQPLGVARPASEYVPTICVGLYRHVLRGDDREWILAGSAHRGHGSDLRWVSRQPAGNAWVRGASWVVTKVLRRVTERVTIDLPSFTRARHGIPDGCALALVPSHRSYLDFVLVSYLAFARPDLGLPIPHIAATMEFGRIPLLGRLLSALHAFYLRRGVGAADPELTRRVHALLEGGRCLEFFVEGARSRDRSFLPPKRGLLRCLQATNRPVAVVPIAISYDRVPEEASFARELRGEPKPPMRLAALLAWTWRALKGKVRLGRVHLAAGPPLVLDAATDIPAAADDIVAGLRGALAVTTYHLHQYAALHPVAGHDGESLAKLLRAKGVRVLESSLPVDPAMSPEVARTLGEHFTYLLPELFQTPSSRSFAASSVRLRTSSRL